MNRIKLWWREGQPDRWCAAANYEHGHVQGEFFSPGLHECGYDYCYCWKAICSRCGDKILYNYGYDECR